MQFSLREISLALGLLSFLIVGTANADFTSTGYSIGAEAIDAGGLDISTSNHYSLSDSIGESIVGDGSSQNYQLESGYRQPSAAEFLSMACTQTVAIGAIIGTGQQTGSGSCTVFTDAQNGYNLGWSVQTGSGGVNTGSLINEFNDTIPPYTPTIENMPETWSIAPSASEWGARVRSVSTDSAAEWGIDGISEKWLNISTSHRSFIRRSSATQNSGSTEVLQFRSEVGLSKLQPSGEYQAEVTLTVVGY